MTDDLPQQLQAALGDGYQIERELGGAGMSRVFAAQETALQRRVVIKVLPPGLAAGVNHDRFRREIQLAAGLQHPHIVPLLTAGEEGGLLWFTMPFIEGESLRAAILRRGRFPARDVVRVLRDVTDALAYAHARGVVHRDIKPGNILTSGMHALVTDFGVAKALTAAIPSANGGTTTGMAIGTPAYMAPEQLAADPAADHRMDIYAVGLLGYELLTGKSPFGGTSPQATLAAQLTQMPEPPSRTLPDVPAGLSNIIMQCLEKDANKRPPSAIALLAELDALPMSGSGETPARKAANPRRASLIALTVIALLAVSFVILQRRLADSDKGNRNSVKIGAPVSRGTSAPIASAHDGANDGMGDSAVHAGNTVDAAMRPGTVVVYRDTGISHDGQTRTVLPIVLSRAESVAIASAFRKRQAEAPTAPASPALPDTRTGPDGKVVIMTRSSSAVAPIARESLLVEIGRVFSDSIARVISQMHLQLSQLPQAAAQMPQAVRMNERFAPLIAPPTDGRPRVVIQSFNNGTGRREFAALGRNFADSLRSSLGALGSISIVDEATTTQAGRGSASFVTVGWSLRADYVITGTYLMRGDSIVLVTQFNDVRRGRFTRASESAAPATQPLRALTSSLSQVHAWIDSARTARGSERGGGPSGGRGSGGRPPGT